MRPSPDPLAYMCLDPKVLATPLDPAGDSSLVTHYRLAFRALARLAHFCFPSALAVN